MKTIRVAIIGQGRSGRDIHGAYLKQVPEQYKIVAVTDPIEERRKRAEEEYSCKSYLDYHEILQLDNIDLIVNATPSHLHVPVTLDILNAGFNVLCEKPLARKVEEVDMLIGAAEKSGKVFAIYQQSRFAPYFKQVRKVIDSGVLGRIVQISIAFNGFARRWDWQCMQKNNGGSLLNTGPHPLDQALQLFGTDMMPEVYCIMDRCNTFGDAEDYVKLILKGKGRPVIDLEISSCCAYPSFTYNIQATRGGLKGSMTHIDWKYFKEEEAPTQQLITEPLEKPDGTPAYCGETLKWYEGSWDVSEENKNLFNTMAGSFYDMLYRTLTEGAELEITPQEVKQQIAVIEEAHRQNPLSRMY
ncbi:MAG TPA: Gfo/Idh/MocA family oxidoreductase [Clostridiaceae bacterium]|jgi:scyllo-inositol 2-dehydrogenase (NADP+)|nr:Gfo/Idh/MocA family oxidoreductase [Clostridiaceae bacterium]